jgi:signal transduction histidine kinase
MTTVASPFTLESVPGASTDTTSAREVGELTRRWLRPLGATTIAVILALSIQQHPAPALHGSGLAVTIALLVLVASFVALMRHVGGPRGGMLALTAMVLASSALVYAQHGGPGVAGLFVAVAYAAMNLSLRDSLGTLALAVATLAVAAAHAQRSVGLIVGAELGVVAFYVLAAFARRVQEAHEETARLLAELATRRRSQEEAAALRERSRIAREIHDVLAHSLSGLMLQLEGARMLVGTPSSNGQLPAALERAHHLAHAGLEEARRAIGALRDEELPGADRLDQLALDFSRDAGVPATLHVTGEPNELDSERSLTLFRVAQEALTNAGKHARAERVELHLAYEPGGTRLVVADHGRSEAALAPAGGQSDEVARHGVRPGYGLTGMRERAELLGGTLDAGPTNDGFRVELWIPP